MERHFDRTLRHLWKNELNKLNDHVPAQKIPLSTMLEMKRPSFPTRDGTESSVSRGELLDLANNIPTEFHARIELPFVFLRRMDMGRGTYTLLGSKLDKFCVERLLEFDKALTIPWTLFKTNKPRHCYYTYHIFQFRKRFRSLSTIAFATAPTNNDETYLNRDL